VIPLPREGAQKGENMKRPNLILVPAFAILVASLASATSAQAQLVNQQIREEAIVPEQASTDDVVVVKRKRAPQPRQIIIEEEPAFEAEPVNATAVAMAQVAPQPMAQPKTVGSTLDQGLQTKMDGVRQEFENALLRSLDRIKITVDDGGNPPAPTTQVVTDSLAVNSAAPLPQASDTYVSVEGAPTIVVPSGQGDVNIAQSSTAEQSPSTFGKVRVAPVVGFTTINSDDYDIESKYTAGVMIEADVSENLSVVLGYTYTQHDISLGTTNPFWNGWNQGFVNNNQQTLRYNQNVFEGGLRVYLMPDTSRFRMHLGAGLGYNLGYLNYEKSSLNTFAPNNFQNLEDYEVKSFLGTLETGAEFKVAKNVSIAANARYARVLSATENSRLNNNGFVLNGFGQSVSTDQENVGGSLAENSFYSILGGVKVSF
jgi:opacity protein-like surface antigen